MRNENGAFKVVLAFGAVIAVVAAMFYAGHTTGPVKAVNPNTPVKVAKNVEMLKPTCTPDGCKGGYAYRDDSGLWWYYWFSMDSNSGSARSSYASYGRTLPAGGTWEKSTQGPPEDVVQEQGQVDVAQYQGAPETDAAFDAQLAAAVQDNPEHAGVQPDNTDDSISNSAAASESVPSDTSTSTDSGSSDAGSSGGDGGGGSD